jgi:SWI/SNF-related matrix-associated actin-dependent regulator of chromatin subfamily A3
MAVIDAKLTSSDQAPFQPYQSFTLTGQPDHVLLSFKNDRIEFGYLRSNMNKALGDLLSESTLEFEAVAPTITLRETIGRAKKASEAMVKVDINVYGPRSSALSVGQRLSAYKLWLQRPDHSRVGLPYDNPHVLDIPGIEPDELPHHEDMTPRSPDVYQNKDQLLLLLSHVYNSLNRSWNLGTIHRHEAISTELAR